MGVSVRKPCPCPASRCPPLCQAMLDGHTRLEGNRKHIPRAMQSLFSMRSVSYVIPVYNEVCIYGQAELQVLPNPFALRHGDGHTQTTCRADGPLLTSHPQVRGLDIR